MSYRWKYHFQRQRCLVPASPSLPEEDTRTNHSFHFTIRELLAEMKFDRGIVDGVQSAPNGKFLLERKFEFYDHSLVLTATASKEAGSEYKYTELICHYHGWTVASFFEKSITSSFSIHPYYQKSLPIPVVKCPVAEDRTDPSSPPSRDYLDSKHLGLYEYFVDDQWNHHFGEPSETMIVVLKSMTAYGRASEWMLGVRDQVTAGHLGVHILARMELHYVQSDWHDTLLLVKRNDASFWPNTNALFVEGVEKSNDHTQVLCTLTAVAHIGIGAIRVAVARRMPFGLCYYFLNNQIVTCQYPTVDSIKKEPCFFLFPLKEDMKERVNPPPPPANETLEEFDERMNREFSRVPETPWNEWLLLESSTRAEAETTAAFYYTSEKFKAINKKKCIGRGTQLCFIPKRHSPFGQTNLSRIVKMIIDV